ncbi:unnamed protein product [Brassica oleracea]
MLSTTITWFSPIILHHLETTVLLRNLSPDSTIAWLSPVILIRMNLEMNILMMAILLSLDRINIIILSNFEQRRMVNVNAFHNHNMVLPNYPSPFGNYSRVEGFVPGFNHNMALPSHHNPNESGNEHPHDGHPPQPRSD